MPMNILVLMKQTFDTEERIVIRDGAVSEDGVEFIINPYDEYAIEEAVRLKEALGAEVTVITVGPQRAENALRTALAMGADQAVLIELTDSAWDEAGVAKALVAAVKERPYDLILGGNMAVDSGAGQVAIRVAEELGIPHISTVTRLTLDGRRVTAERDVEGDAAVVEAELPVLVTAQQGLNEPRYPSLPGIMKAKKKPLERLNPDDLGLSAEDVRPRTTVLEQYLPAKKQAGKVLTGEIGEQVSQLVHMLRTEANVI